MKLLNQSLLYLSLAFLIIIGIWSIVFYYNLKDEIRDSIDDGLENSKMLIVQKVHTDSTLLLQQEFGGNNFEVHPIPKSRAITFKDTYKDTMMYRVNENDLEPVRILHSAFQYKNNYYHLKVISSLVEEDDLIEDSFWSVVSLFFILVFSTLIINNIVLRRMWNPFYEILNRLKTYKLGKDEKSIETATNIKEFKELQHASNTLIKHAKEAYTSQKQFTENASHELQTPLAIIINKLELLLEAESLSEADAQSIDNIIKIADRVTQLNKSLLLLAKIENKQFPNQELVFINELVNERMSDFEDFIAYKNIDINYEEKNDLVVNIDPSLAQILITNLVKNALFHNHEAGSITIKLFDTTLQVCNTGSEVELESKSIFNRFQKHSHNQGSIGLGLAICKAICDLYELDINYRFISKKHCFSVDFKKIITAK